MSFAERMGDTSSINVYNADGEATVLHGHAVKVGPAGRIVEEGYKAAEAKQPRVAPLHYSDQQKKWWFEGWDIFFA